jgi:hypothetical protein
MGLSTVSRNRMMLHQDDERRGYLPPRPAPSFNPDWSVLTIFVQRQLKKGGRASHNHCGVRDRIEDIKECGCHSRAGTRCHDQGMAEASETVKLVPDLSNILLTDSDRTGHLPKRSATCFTACDFRGMPSRAFPSLHPRTAAYGSRRATLHPC